MVGAERCTASGSVSENTSAASVGPVVGSRREAAFHLAAEIVCVDEVDGQFIIVAIALLAIDHPYIPFEPIMEKTGPLPKHFFQQIRMLVRVRTFNDDNHLANSFDNQWSGPQPSS